MNYTLTYNGLSCTFVQSGGKLQFLEGRRDLFKKLWLRMHLGSDPWGHVIDLFEGGSQDWVMDASLRALSGTTKGMTIRTTFSPLEVPKLPQGSLS